LGCNPSTTTELPVGIHAAIPIVLEVVWREGRPAGLLLFTLSPFLTMVCAFVGFVVALFCGFAEKQLRMMSEIEIFQQLMPNPRW
jgi:hypothetical protein